MSRPFQLPLSRSKLGRLGKRLVAGTATPDDHMVYGEVMDLYDQLQNYCRNELDRLAWSEILGRPIEMDISGRAKSIDTLLQKLERSPGLTFGYIEDVAGVRIVGDFTLAEQTRLTDAVQQALGSPSAKIVDRRTQPASGYRALHVICRVDDLPLEVQVRTRAQALWADVYERVADTWGRQIRYGGPPDPPTPGEAGAPTLAERQAVVANLIKLSIDVIATFEGAEDALAVVQRTLATPQGAALLNSEEFLAEVRAVGIHSPEDVRQTLEEAVRATERARGHMEEALLTTSELLGPAPPGPGQRATVEESEEGVKER